MTHLRNYHGTGLIAPASGAAVAALKARAAAWDVPLTETTDGLCLHIWGAELRLIPDAGALRIDLLAPEDRLIGILRDSATEIMAEAGLQVAWENVQAGALAPGLSLMTVSAVTRPVTGFRRVRLTGPDAGRFGHGGLHFRLLLPPAGRIAVWPRVAATGRTLWPEGSDALHRPVYTVLGYGPDWLEFDIFHHTPSPTCDWVASDPVGQTVGVLGPGGGWCPDAPSLLLMGDQTALPAVARILSLTQGCARAILRCDRDDLGALDADPRVSRCGNLLAALEETEIAADMHVWFAASAPEARAARALLLKRGLPRKQITSAAYWAPPVTSEERSDL
ncbi:MAG: siderophore-interacting protein [Paracoccus sp. (in: a-proteobacteria)]|uniref:siderophore-interacting protein n=1 Tax=Paracoccus sp. TaxID=267 RepID=UPI002E84C3A3|nr:siderophore-interacting protein [Pseudomonadota bacterium]